MRSNAFLSYSFRRGYNEFILSFRRKNFSHGLSFTSQSITHYSILQYDRYFSHVDKRTLLNCGFYSTSNLNWKHNRITMNGHLSAGDRMQVVSLRFDDVVTQNKIASIINCSRAIVFNILQLFHEINSVNEREGRGRTLLNYRRRIQDSNTVNRMIRNFMRYQCTISVIQFISFGIIVKELTEK